MSVRNLLMCRVVLIFAVLLLVTAEKRKNGPMEKDGDNSYGGKPGVKPGDDGKRGGKPEGYKPKPTRPTRKTCDPETIENDPLKTIVDGLLSGNADVIALIPMIESIPLLCFRPDDFKDVVFTEDQAKTALCNCKGAMLKMRTIFMKIKNSPQQCDILQNALDDNECIESRDLIMERRKTECGLIGLTPAEVLNGDLKDMLKFFKSLNQTDKRVFNKDAGNAIMEDPELLKTIPCPNMKVYVGMQVEILSQDLDSIAEMVETEDFWTLPALLPYMDAKTCESISFQQLLLKNDSIVELDFMCKPVVGNGCGKPMPQKGGEKRDKKTQNAAGSSPAPSKVRSKRRCGPPCHLPCGGIIIKTLMENKESATAAEQEQIESMVNLQVCQNIKDILEGAESGKCQSLNADVMKSAIKGTNKQRTMQGLAKKCKPQKDARNINLADLESMGCAAAAFKDINKIPDDVLCDATFLNETLGPCLDLIPNNRKHVMRKCRSEMTNEQLKDLGAAAVFAGSDQLRTLGIGLKKEAATKMNEGLKKMSKQRRKAVAFQIAGSADPKELMGSKELAKAVPLKKMIDALENSTVEDFIRGRDMSGLKLSHKGKMMEKFLTEKDKGTTDLTVEDVDNMGNLLEGLPPSKLQTFNDTIKMDVFTVLCKLSGFTGRQSETVAGEMMYLLEDISPENPLDVLSEAEVLEYQGDCLARFSMSALRNASRNIRHALCQRIGFQPRLKCLLNKERRAELATVCADIDDVEEDDNTTDPVANSGMLIADMDPEQIDGMTGDKILNILPLIGPVRCLTKNMRDKVIMKLEDVITVEDMKDPEKLGLLGEFALMIKKDQHVDAAEELATYVSLDDGDDDNEDLSRNMLCCLSDMNTEDMNAAEMFTADTKLSQLKVMEATEADTSGRRRKRRSYRGPRSTPIFTCQDVMDMDQSLLTDQHVLVMADEEFSLCLSTFGTFVSHMSTTKFVIMNRLRMDNVTYMCDLTQDMLVDMGSLASAMTLDEIECLNNFNDNTNLGGYSDYTEEQLVKFAAKYMASNSIDSASMLNSSDLSNMGHFVCGLTAEQITMIHHDVYGTSSSVIRDLDACPQAALEAWSQKAVDHFGEVSTWDHATFNEAGILLGGLTAEQIADVDADDVSGWTTNGIQNIQPEILQGMDVALLWELDRFQVYSFLDEQLNALSDESMNAIYFSMDGFDGSTAKSVDTSGDMVTTTTMNTMTTMLTMPTTSTTSDGPTSDSPTTKFTSANKSSAPDLVGCGSFFLHFFSFLLSFLLLCQ